MIRFAIVFVSLVSLMVLGGTDLGVLVVGTRFDLPDESLLCIVLASLVWTWMICRKRIKRT